MKIIGITGNSGAGKSTVCKILENKYNLKIINADRIANRLINEEGDYFDAIVDKFGEEILDEIGLLDRRKLAKIIFNDKTKRTELNNITFKYIVEEIKEEIGELSSEKIVIIDAPLLFESKLNEICDSIVGVVASDNIKLDRICKRDLIAVEDARKRLSAQLNNEFLRMHADYIIENNSTMEDLEKKVKKFYNNVT